MNRRFCSLAILLVSVGLMACGSEGDTTVIREKPKQAQTVTEETKTITEEAPAPEAAPQEEASGGALPDVVGERLDVAKRELKEAGYSTRTVGGGIFGVVLPENWVVCDQEPTGSAPSGSKIDLTVDRSC